MARARAAAPLLVAALVVVGAVGLLGYSASLNPIDALLGRGPMVRVPDVTGRTRPRAVSDLEAVGLRSTFVEAFSLDVPRGAVARTSPSAGARLRTGEVVRVVVSKGLNRAVMPAAVGRQVGSVVGPLRAAGIDVRVRRVWSSTPAGTVLVQDPEPGTVVQGRDQVLLTVSRGPRPRKVPDVVGLTPAGAGYRIGSAGLRVGTVTFVDDPGVPVGAVASARPPVGADVAQDTVVDLRISAGPAPVAMPSVVGAVADAAVEQLRAAGFVVQVQVRTVPPGDLRVDTVVSQSPAPTTPWRPRDPVSVVVARVPVPVVTTTTTTTLPPPPTLPPTVPPTVAPTVPPTSAVVVPTTAPGG